MLRIFLVPRGQHQKSQPLGLSNFLSMRKKFVSDSQPFRFVKIESAHAQTDEKSVNRGLLVLLLDLLKDLKGRDPWYSSNMR